MTRCTCGVPRTHAAGDGPTILQYDPTHTLTLRRRWAGKFTKVFRGLKGVVRRSMVENDCLALRQGSRPPRVMAQGEPPGRFDPARFKQFDFAKNDRKVSEFIQWLEDQQDLGIFGVSRNIPMDQAADRMWQNIYIDQGYQKGIQRAIQEAKRAGYEVPWEDTPAVQLMNQPYHADAVGLIHTRAYSDLRGITQAMDTQISRVLAEGLAAGISPRELADRISHVVDTVGINRARTLARTEVVRAHHIAMMNEFERAQVSGVAVKSEWDTANDGRVCPICAALEGRIFRLGEIRDMIPRHPNCRCVALPVTPDTNPEEF